jgi:hypothetical protein
MIQLYRNMIQLHRAGIELANDNTACGRCNRAYFNHLWILVDSDEAEQGGVIDCAGAA